jgi:hypothetical protein
MPSGVFLAEPVARHKAQAAFVEGHLALPAFVCLFFLAFFLYIQTEFAAVVRPRSRRQ